MNEALHTPGPLSIRVCTMPGEAKGDCAILDAEGEIIAETFAMVHYTKFRPAHANAQLFAAAPDLLDACKIALEWFDKRGDGPGFTTVEIWEMLDKACAKAGHPAQRT